MIFGTLSITFAVVSAAVFVAIVIIVNRVVMKSWKLKGWVFSLILCAFFSFFGLGMGDTVSSTLVSTEVPHVWTQRVYRTWSVEEIRKQSNSEDTDLEIVRFAISMKENLKPGESYDPSNRVHFIANPAKVNTVEKLRKVRVYKNPEDEKRFKNLQDLTEAYYVVYTS
jgi:hypothetical protein